MVSMAFMAVFSFVSGDAARVIADDHKTAVGPHAVEPVEHQLLRVVVVDLVLDVQGCGHAPTIRDGRAGAHPRGRGSSLTASGSRLQRWGSPTASDACASARCRTGRCATR